MIYCSGWESNTLKFYQRVLTDIDKYIKIINVELHLPNW